MGGYVTFGVIGQFVWFVCFGWFAASVALTGGLPRYGWGLYILMRSCDFCLPCSVGCIVVVVLLIGVFVEVC